MQGIGTTEARQAPPATKSLDFFEDFSRFSAHPSHNLLKSLCTKGKTNVRDVFYPSQISHIIPHIMLMQPEADTLTKDRQTGGLT